MTVRLPRATPALSSKLISVFLALAPCLHSPWTGQVLSICLFSTTVLFRSSYS